MSVKAYIEKAQSILTEKIDNHRAYIEANPYPAGEIQKAIDGLIANNPEKYKTETLSIPKVWGTNGILTDNSELITKAAAELAEYTKLVDPKKLSIPLLLRLNRGNESFARQKKLDETQKLLDNSNLIEADLVSNYDTLIAKVNEANAKSATPVQVDRIFLLDEYNFKSYLKKYTGGLEYSYIFPAAFPIVSAFKDLHEKRKAEVPKVEVSSAPSPINTKEEPAVQSPIEKPVNTPSVSVINPIGAINPPTTVAPSAINSESDQKKETVETAETSQATVTSKPNQLVEPVVPPKLEEQKQININLENKAPSSDTTKGELFTSNTSTSTTNNTSTTDNKTSSNTTNNSQVSTTASSPTINSDNKQSVFKSVVKSLAKSAGDSLNITNSPNFSTNLGNYLEVGKEKLLGMTSPIINTYNTVKGAIDESKNETTSVTNTQSAVNNKTNDVKTTKEGDTTSTQTTNSQVMVDTKSPVIPKDETLAAPKAPEKSTSLIETSSNKEVKNNNEVTYKESTQISGSNKPEKVETQNQQIIQQGAPVNINMGELVNEMRAIKLLLMSGIDVTHK